MTDAALLRELAADVAYVRRVLSEAKERAEAETHNTATEDYLRYPSAVGRYEGGVVVALVRLGSVQDALTFALQGAST